MCHKKPLLWATKRSDAASARESGGYEPKLSFCNRFVGIAPAPMNDVGCADRIQQIAKPWLAMQYGIFSDARHFYPLIIRMN